MTPAKVAIAGGFSSQWTLKVHIDKIDASALEYRHLVQGMSRWKAGDILSVPIEAHTTVKMLKQSIAEITFVHPTLQVITFGGGCDLAETFKLRDIEILVSLGGGMKNALEEASSMGYFFNLRIPDVGFGWPSVVGETSGFE